MPELTHIEIDELKRILKSTLGEDVKMTFEEDPDVYIEIPMKVSSFYGISNFQDAFKEIATKLHRRITFISIDGTKLKEIQNPEVYKDVKLVIVLKYDKKLDI